MADQTLPLNVSDEMKADDERQNCVLLHQTLLKNCILLRQPTHVETVCLLSKKCPV